MNFKDKEKIGEIRKKITPVLRSFGVEKAALFGSFARGEERSESDVDILVSLPEGSTLFELAGLQIELSQKLGRKVDVVTYRSLKPRLEKYILADQVEII